MKPDAAQAIADAIAARFNLGDLSPAERARVVDIVTSRIGASVARATGAGHVRATLLKPAFLDLEILVALQMTLQETALQQTRELLSTIKSGFEGLVADINAFFGLLEATEKRLQIVSTAGKNLPPPYRPIEPEDQAASASRLQALVSERGWAIPVGTIRDIESGIKAVLQARYPNSVESDFQPIVDVVRDRAVAVLQENESKWPKGSKGNWYVSQLDALATSHPALFTAVLIRN